eukprot:295688_1
MDYDDQELAFRLYTELERRKTITETTPKSTKAQISIPNLSDITTIPTVTTNITPQRIPHVHFSPNTKNNIIHQYHHNHSTHYNQYKKKHSRYMISSPASNTNTNVLVPSPKQHNNINYMHNQIQNEEEDEEKEIEYKLNNNNNNNNNN